MLLSLVSCLGACAVFDGHFQAQSSGSQDQIDTSEALRQQRIGPGQVSPEEIQSQLMSYVDTYADVLLQARIDAAREVQELNEQIDPALARNHVRLHVRAMQNAAIIAAGPNPVTALLDMTTMVSLQRMTWEEYWMPEWYGPPGQHVLDALVLLEDEIWEIVRLALEQDEQEALRELILEMRERYPGQEFVSGLRASEFAADRQSAFVKVQGGGNLLRLFALDPLAGLDPATAELIRARLMAERAFFYARWLPDFSRWQTELFVVGLTTLPEFQTFVDSADQAGDAAQRAAAVAEDLSARLEQERAAAIDQAAERIGEQRQIAIEQLMDGIADEREAIFAQLEQGEEGLRDAIGELRVTVEASTDLVEALAPTMEVADSLSRSLTKLKERRPGDRPFDVTEYESAIVAATEMVRELNAAMDDLEQITVSPMWNEQKTELRLMAAEGRSNVEGLIDLLFQRAIVVVAILCVGLSLGIFLALAGARLVPQRHQQRAV